MTIDTTKQLRPCRMIFRKNGHYKHLKSDNFFLITGEKKREICKILKKTIEKEQDQNSQERKKTGEKHNVKKNMRWKGMRKPWQKMKNQLDIRLIS